MADKSVWGSIKPDGDQIVETLKTLLAAIGVLVAMAKDCTIEVQRAELPSAQPGKDEHAA
jgi:hypothetical protein